MLLVGECGVVREIGNGEHFHRAFVAEAEKADGVGADGLAQGGGNFGPVGVAGSGVVDGADEGGGGVGALVVLHAASNETIRYFYTFNANRTGCPRLSPELVTRGKSPSVKEV